LPHSISAKKKERKRNHSFKDLLLIKILTSCERRHCRHITFFIKWYYRSFPLFFNNLDSRKSSHNGGLSTAVVSSLAVDHL